MDTKIYNAINYVCSNLTEREQRAFLNRFAFRFGIRLHARDVDAYARPAERYTTDDDDGDYKTCEVPGNGEKPGYEQKLQLVMRIIDNRPKEMQGFDLMARGRELRLLVDTLTYGQLSRLNFNGFCRMLRVTAQSYDKNVSNQIAYILTGFKNLTESKDYRTQWEAERTARENRSAL